MDPNRSLHGRGSDLSKVGRILLSAEACGRMNSKMEGRRHKLGVGWSQGCCRGWNHVVQSMTEEFRFKESGVLKL